MVPQLREILHALQSIKSRKCGENSVIVYIYSEAKNYIYKLMTYEMVLLKKLNLIIQMIK